MDRSRDFDTKEEAFQHAQNSKYVVMSNAELGDFACAIELPNPLPKIKYKLQKNEEGLFYWEIC